MKDEVKRARDRMVRYLKMELVGPRFGEKELLPEAPYKRYTAGTLYQPEALNYKLTDEEEPELDGVAGAAGDFEEQADDPIVLANQYLPSSLGISFYLQGNPDLEVEINAARYKYVHTDQGENNDGAGDAVGSGFRRLPLTTRRENGNLVVSPPDHGNRMVQEIFDGRARLDVIWRSVDQGWLVTVSLINNLEKQGFRIDPESCLHQVEINCRPTESGRIPAYPRNRIVSDDLEEQILDILYRENVMYGVGHGCSVDWDEKPDKTASEIRSEVLPSFEIMPIRYDLDEDFSKIQSLYYLAEGQEYPEQLIEDLKLFIQVYRDWIDRQIEDNKNVPPDLNDARDTLITRMRRAADRMERGVRLLEINPEVRKAFCLANQAMLMQYAHSQPEYAGDKRSTGSKSYREPRLSEYKDRRWRPFQLAFQLLTLPSVAFPEDPDREIVDLIWFPTGGGKTEAYLAVTAFQIFYRRMMHGNVAGGTTAIMRYTLRLLTTQQFQRAATLLCACEMIRRENSSILGQQEISIGLWVGASTTPNTFQEAFEIYQKLLEEDIPASPFQIDRCPWCGTGIVPEKKSPDLDLYGIQSSPESFSLYCPEPSCPFHKKLPIGVVDDQLYKTPPTLLLATVDKFARMTWVEQAGEFFGAGHRRPPELIIQDELHLISGPLGTIVGVYEIAIDALIDWNGEPPKVLASTATIRRADEQCKGLYARPVELFPPSGLKARDSYFARYDESQPGRLYVGFMGQGHTGSTTMIRLAAALLQGAVELGLAEHARDAYWTLIAYHNSLRELGKTLTFARDDIPARIKVIATDQARLRDLSGDNVEELTSSTAAPKLSGILDRLARRYDQDGDISLLACTNMFSVGVDVQRLGLMLVNGQPKSTSEYIQSTSRVGRGVPGLVVTLLSPSKPRDRSHYERFIAYHSALYRYVEPNSVTPFAPPARARTLHAVLVTMVRHALGLSDNREASDFSETLKGLDSVVNYIDQRVSEIDPREEEATMSELEDLIEDWEIRIQETDKRLVYSSYQPQRPSLLRTAGYTRKTGWDTLHSMRNIDRSCVIKIIEN